MRASGSAVADLDGGGAHADDSAPEGEDEGLAAYSDPFGSGGPVPAGDEDGPPLDEIEAQMRGEVSARDGAAAASASARRLVAARADDEDEGAEGKSARLPELDELVARIPAEVRETLDELFRARFIQVKRLPKKAFAAAKTKGAPPADGAAAA